MKNKSINQVSIINGEDGPTSVFIFGEAQKQSLKIRIRNAIYQSRRKRIEKRIAVNPHTLAEVVQYAKDHYDLVEINPAATNWIERQKNLKASLIMQHKPELLGQRKDIPKPDFHNEESVKNFLNEMEIRNKLIDQMPDNVIPMDFHLYEIKIGEDLMEIEVDYTWNIFGISYSGNKSVIKRFKKIARDLYCYYGVSEEDIKKPDKKIFFTGNGIEFIIQNFKWSIYDEENYILFFEWNRIMHSSSCNSCIGSRSCTGRGNNNYKFYCISEGYKLLD